MRPRALAMTLVLPKNNLCAAERVRGLMGDEEEVG